MRERCAGCEQFRATVDDSGYCRKCRTEGEDEDVLEHRRFCGSPATPNAMAAKKGSRERAPSRGCSTGTRGSKSKALDSHVPLTEEDVAVLLACRDDGEPPVEIHDATIHRRLEAQGLLSRRSGPSPDGDGEAEFWRTTEFGVWALWYLGRVEQNTSKPEGGG